MNNKGIFLFCLIIMTGFVFNAHAQGISISGNVTASEDGRPIPGVNVVVKGATTGAVTDFDGNYSIQVPSANAVLVYSYLGYANKEVSVNGRSSIDVVLVEEATELQDVVVIGYGTQSRATVTSAIAQVTAEEIESSPTPGLSSALQGRLAGVSVRTQGSAQPGSQASITVRGGSFINQNAKSSEPLYVVDGVPRYINDINPEDIKSVNVLKDAAAASIYGARASNGVVLIETKRGKSGKASVQFHTYTGFQKIAQGVETLNSRQLLEIYRPAVLTSHRDDTELTAGRFPVSVAPEDNPFGWSTRFLESGEQIPSSYESLVDPVTGRTLIFQDNDWSDIILRDAVQSNYHLNFNGGSDAVRYNVGLGYTKQDGIVKSTEYERFSNSVKLDFQASEKLHFFTNLDYTYSKSNALSDERTLFIYGLSNPTTLKRRNSDGSFTAGFSGGRPNPEWYLTSRDDDTKNYNLTLSAGGAYDLSESLKLKTSVSYYSNNRARDFFKFDHPISPGNAAVAERDRSTTFQSETLLDYNHTFGEKHNVQGIAGFTYLSLLDEFIDANANNSSTNLIKTFNIFSGDNTRVTSFVTNERLISQFARLQYNFDYKYLLSASYRRDGSSKFGSNNRYAGFASMSAGWVVSEEAFLKESDFISMLKLRGSYGQTGNNDLGFSRGYPNRFQAQGEYTPFYTYAGNSGIISTALPNPDLKWEKTTQLDIGFDLGLFNNRVSLSADYYTKDTENVLFALNLPNESGYDTYTQNIGSVRYSGYDLQLSTVNINSDNFSWTTDFNLGYSTNEVTKLPFKEGVDKNRINGLELEEVNGISRGIGGFAEGERVDNMIGYQVAYIIDNEAQAAQANYDSDATAWDPESESVIRGKRFPGDFEWEDRDNNDTINARDQFVLGHSLPDFYGGFNNSFKYKNFELSVFFDFALGHTIYDQARSNLNTLSGIVTSGTTDVLDAWQAPGDAARTNQPRIYYHDSGGTKNHSRQSDFYHYKGDYLSIRNVSLSYNFDKKTMGRIPGINSINLYVTGNNLHYFTAYPGANPESGGRRSQFNNASDVYPVSKTYVAGVKIGF